MDKELYRFNIIIYTQIDSFNLFLFDAEIYSVSQTKNHTLFVPSLIKRKHNFLYYGNGIKYHQNLIFYIAVKDVAPYSKFPWHAIVISDEKACGGSLIDIHLVLTSASCVVGYVNLIIPIDDYLKCVFENNC